MKYLQAAALIISLIAQVTAQDASHIYEKTVGSTVTIYGPTGLGSGFFVGDYLIATNYHVVDEPGRYFCSPGNSDSQFRIDEIVAADAKADLALLRVVGLNRPAIPFALRDVAVGQQVYAVGSPLGLTATFAPGYVSAKRDDAGTPLIQFTAPISPGNSGGPVVNSAGEVVGITVSYREDGQNLNFAVPVSALQRLLNQNGITPVTSRVSHTDQLRIEGNKSLTAGERASLSVSGGYLAPGADWVWYADRCGGKEIGRGANLDYMPGRSTTVFVRAEGSGASSRCASAALTVDPNSSAPTGITGPETVCVGSEAILSVEGGALGLGAEWVWSADYCGGASVGTGATIRVYPKVSTTYYVRAVGSKNITTCARRTIQVTRPSSDPASVKASAATICEGNSVTLSVAGGGLAPEANWVWYTGQCGGRVAGTGPSITASPRAQETYYVRAEGVCNVTRCVSQAVSVMPRLGHPGSIVGPPAVIKNKKINLAAPSAQPPAGAEWRWYLNSCTGAPVGTGSTISIKPREQAIYYLKAVSKCHESPCVDYVVNPVKSRSWTKGYMIPNQFLHLGLGFGAEYFQFEALTDVQNPGSFQAPRQIDGTGLQAELVFHPLFKKMVSLGLMGGGALGSTPYAVIARSNGDHKYLYHRYQYGVELAFGLNGFKLLGTQTRFVQANNYIHTIAIGTGTDQVSTYTTPFNQEVLGLGLRLGNYLRGNNKRSFQMDLLYTVRQPASSSPFGSFDYRNPTDGHHGASISMWRHSGFKLRGEAVFAQDDQQQPIFNQPPAFMVSLLFVQQDRFR